MTNSVATLRRLGTAARSVEKSVSFTLSNRFRIEILAVLHEGPASVKELAKAICQSVSVVSHHVHELLSDGSIEIARTEESANVVQHIYRIIQLPYYSDEDIAAMSPEERQALASLILKASLAEAMASLYAGKMSSDPRVMLAWNRVNLDRQGRADLADEQARSWKRQHEIEAESANRMAESTESGVTYVVAMFGFERSRTSAPEPLQPEFAAAQRVQHGRGSSEPCKAKAFVSARHSGRGVEKSVSFALSNRFRIEILAVLHEGPASVKELAKAIHQSVATAEHHVKQLLKDGSIEVAKTKTVNNFVEHIYRIIQLPYYSDEDIAAMSPEERQALASLIIQASAAEAMASLYAGKMSSDPRVMLAWNRVNLDRQGRADLADEQARSWKRQHEIEAESANRMAESTESGVTYVVAMFGFERSRTSAPEPLHKYPHLPSGIDSPSGIH